MSQCIDDNAVAALLDPELPAEERAALTAHLDSCDSCRALVADVTRLDEPGGQRVLVPGATLGRYVVLELVGAGAMGVVYAAYDPQLGRKIALKLLRPDDESGGGGRDRLLREAQSLAKLSHPNVINIHDVGALDGEVFLAMEFVEKGTLGEWLAAQPRDWRAIARVMHQVGEGLAAAHAAGLVHRDLKPDNVLVGADDRARVTDFGLSRGVGRTEEVPVPIASLELTATGAVMGTPAYMAPEQLAGRLADELSDQFSFCVTFHEALFGARPFVATSTGARASTADRKVPGWLRKLVERGLAGDRAARFPTLRALLTALERGPVVSPRRVVIGVALVAAVASVTIAATRTASAKCTGADAAWGDAWDDTARAKLAGAFANPTTSGKVADILDDDAARWRAMHHEVCEATDRGEQSAQAMDERMRCLGARRNEVVALVRVFATADQALVARSVSAVLQLPSLADCANARALSAAPVDPGLAGPLAEAAALEYTGFYDKGLALAEPALDKARQLPSKRTAAQLALVVGKLAMANHAWPRATVALHEAASQALAAGDLAVAADAWTTLVRLVGVFLAKPDEGRVWAGYAAGAIASLGGDDEREAARLRLLASVAWRIEGKFDEARGYLARARALFDAGHGPHRDFLLASCDEGLAGVEFDTGRIAAAYPLHRHVLEVRERLFGPDHPSIATALSNVGEDLVALGRAQEAVPMLRRAVAIVGSTRDSAVYFHHRLGLALRATGDAAAALVEDDAALVGNARAHEQGTVWEGWGLTGKGEDLLMLGRNAEAVPVLEAALSARAEDKTPIEVAETKFALAKALGHTDRGNALAKEAADTIAPDAKRFGSLHAALAKQIADWL